MRNSSLFILASLLVASAGAFEAPAAGAQKEPVRFLAVDVFVNSGEAPLAAYQFEMIARGGDARIVGVEGGEHPAFSQPPYYDPAALKGGRIIIAAFDTGKDLPKGRTRVATIHVREAGATRPEYSVALTVAATLDGKRIAATAAVGQGEGK